MIFTVVECLALAGWACIVLYCLTLCMASWMTRLREAPLIWPRHVFAMLIPAQNAEPVIGQTLERLYQGLRYPRDMFDLIVIPVHCTDRTAAISRQKGAVVYERGNREWADWDDAIQSSLERLLSKRRYDAYVILEAGTEVSPNFLAVMSDKLSKGAKAVQAGYQIASPLTAWAACITPGMRAISMYLCPLWQSRRRFSIGLQRIGMCLTRYIVEQYGVRSPAITDSTAYTTRLLLDNTLVSFAPKALVFDAGQTSPAPERRSLRQRFAARWQLIRQSTIPLIRSGIQWRSATQVSGAIHLLIPPFPWLFGGSLILLAMTTLSHRFTPTPYSAKLVIGWELVIIGQMIMMVSGLVHARAPALVYLALPSTPLYLLWRSCQAWLRGFARRTEETTPRGRVLSTAGRPVSGRRVANRSTVRKTTLSRE